MKDRFSDIINWLEVGKRFAIATVVDTWRSAPRPVGSSMLISEDQEVIGSVSGGCVEGSVINQAKSVLNSGTSELLTFGISNDEAWTVGLSCGGKIKVFVEPFLACKQDPVSSAQWQVIARKLQTKTSFVLAHEMNAEARKMVLDSFDEEIKSSPLDLAACEALGTRESTLITLDKTLYFLQVFPPQNHLLIIGAAHLGVDLVQLAQALDFRTTVIDPRGIFTESLRSLCLPDELIEGWPADVLSNYQLDQNTFAVTLTHDPKIDDQALEILLNEDVNYIGALGSRKTHAKRIARLKAKGFTEDQLNKINGPIGVSIGARSAKEIALSIVAQLVEYRHQQKQTTNHAQTNN